MATIRTITFQRLEGDFDGSGVVDLNDRDEFFAHFGGRLGTAKYAFAFDLNGDGVINNADYLLWTRKISHAV